MTYSQGATNRKVYSIGSVIPVKKEVKPPERYKPPLVLRFLLGKQRYIAKAAPGRPNIIVAKRPAKNLVP